MMANSSKNINLVLSGGGARGIAHIGVIEELERQGYTITSISGTSMGALVGAVYALGKLEEFKSWLLTLGKFEVFKLVDFTFSKRGLIKGDRIFKQMSEFVSDADFSELSIPLSVSVTNLSTNKEVIFTHGSVFDAVRASIAIPTVFTPVIINGQTLVDGGVVNNLPIANVKRFDGDLLVTVDVNVPIIMDVNGKHDKKLSYFDIINKSLLLLLQKSSELTLASHKPDLMINISGECANLFDFHKTKKLVELGRKSVNVK